MVVEFTVQMSEKDIDPQYLALLTAACKYNQLHDNYFDFCPAVN